MATMWDPTVRRSFAERTTRLAADHPAFGNLTYRAYGVLMARHTGHRFRQFGL